jgi:hypothetical protein
MRNPKVNIDTAQAKIVAQIICDEIKTSLQKNDSTYKLAKRCENQYNQVTIWADQNKVCDSPWPGAADYFVPLTEWIIDAVHARVMNTMFSQEPFMTAKGEDSSSIGNEEAATDFVDMAFRRIIRVYDNINFFLKQMIKLPFAVCKYEWVSDYDTQISQEDALVFINPQTGEQQMLLPDDPESQMRMIELTANGYQQSGTQPVMTASDKEIINAPKLQYIRFSDYVWCPNAKRDTRLYWEGDRCWFTLNDLQLKASQDKFIKESVEMVKNQQKYEGLSDASKVVAQRSTLIECFHWFGRLPFNQQGEVDLVGQDTIEQEVYCCVAFNEQELLEIITWPYRRLPYPERVYLRGEFEETEDFKGRSLSEKLYMSQKELNTFLNTIMNNAFLAMQKIFVKKRTLTGQEWEQPSLYPGAMWEEDMPGDVRVLDVGDVKSIGMQLENMFLNFAERISNISITQTGTMRQDGGQKTLGEIQATINEGNIGMDKFIQRCHGIMRKICDWTIDYYIDRMPEGMERTLRDEQTGEEKFPTQDNMALYAQKGIQPTWSPDMLHGKFNWIWNSTSLTASKQWKLAVANDLMDRYLPHPMIAGNMMATWEILKRGLIARGEDWQTILPKREAIQAEMQRMAQEAQARQVQNQVVGKLIQRKGLPANRAEELVKGKSNAGVQKATV